MELKVYDTLPTEASEIRKSVFIDGQGYIPYGEVALEENCPHIWMRKDLNEEDLS